MPYAKAAKSSMPAVRACLRVVDGEGLGTVDLATPNCKAFNELIDLSSAQIEHRSGKRFEMKMVHEQPV